MGFSGTCGNDPDVVTTPSVDDHEQTARRTHAKRNESLLVRVGFIIRDRDGTRIVKDRNRFGQTDAVLAEVASGLTLLVPLETHAVSVRTSCTYVKRVLDGLDETRCARLSLSDDEIGLAGKVLAEAGVERG